MNHITQFDTNLFNFTISKFPDNTFEILDFESNANGFAEPFSFQIKILSTQKLELKEMQNTIIATLSWKDSIRYRGIITEIQQLDPLDHHWTYKITLDSPLFLLTTRSSNRIFTNKTITDILKKTIEPDVFLYPKIRFELKNSNNKKYPLITQYQMTDYDFLMHLMRRYGMWFYFFHENELIFTDSIENLSSPTSVSLPFITVSGTSQDNDCVFDCSQLTQNLPQSVSIRDYNYETPDTKLYATASN